ncbi:MAG: APC family permease [Acidimicrobiia bacterium]|nr:APC family permease [Acidimicrobiia bacterium]
MDARVQLDGIGEESTTGLRRTLTLPLLVFYGVGVTVGAGIFALVGEILAIAEDRAPQSFLLAGLIAAMTGVSYALLVRVYPRAGGEAIFVQHGLGRRFGRATGYGVLVTGIESSAVVALAFAGYLRELVDIPTSVLAVGVVVVLAGLATWGARESVVAAAAITLLEVGTLAVILVVGLPGLGDIETWQRSWSPPTSATAGSAVLSGAIVAFFAFIGFEDIENMAEETVDPVRTAPRAILWTLGITVVCYLAIALIAVAAPDRAAVAESDAPLALLFEQLTGRSGDVVSAMAAVAMINGILVQIMMAARVLFGMGQEGLAPRWLGVAGRRRQTPVRATALVASAVIVLALGVPLLRLAEVTSVVVLAVFAMVNLSLFRLGAVLDDHLVRRWRWLGLVGAAVCVVVVIAGWPS